MDNAVALVRAYLHVNGYFTVTEYPVIEARKDGKYRTVTDLDLLAFRFPTAGRLVLDGFEPDPGLGIPRNDRADMIVGEVKEGRAQLNEGAIDPTVLRAALVRFGCCSSTDVEGVIGELHDRGTGTTPGGDRVRLVAFGSTPPEDPDPPYLALTLGHVLSFLRSYLDVYWDVLRHAHFKDPAFGFLMTLEKAERG